MNAEFTRLLRKYDHPVPRYTSYPALPHWNTAAFDVDQWHAHIAEAFNDYSGRVSVYVHLPYCEKLCTFCACNKKITANHAVEMPYIEAVMNEWQGWRKTFGSRPHIIDLHLGGGTPTFFSPGNLDYLLSNILADTQVPDEHEFAVEVHPNFTTEQHLEVLAGLGFNRISMGVQDFDPTVQAVINRHQTFAQTAEVFEWAAKHHYASINVDLIYGLPLQTVDTITETIRLINTLRPHRIAFYSYAHVPWKSKVQRLFTEADLPGSANKREIYMTGRKLLMEAGYRVIGMDHFALPEDEMFKARNDRTLHRNFMGYTTGKPGLLAGLGVSSISDTGNAYAQNDKKISTYQDAVNTGKQVIQKGHFLTAEEKMIKRFILDLMCFNDTVIDFSMHSSLWAEQVKAVWSEMEEDGILKVTGHRVEVTASGEPFVRNICAALDPYLHLSGIQESMFSKSV